MPLQQHELVHYEGVLQSLKLQDLQSIIVVLQGSKFGKKAELLQRLQAQLRTASTQDRCVRAIREYQQKLQGSIMRPGNYGQTMYGGYTQTGFGMYHPSGNLQFPGPAKQVHGLRPVKLPFFDVVDCLVSPTELPSAPPQHQKLSAKQSVQFTIPPARVPALSYRSDVSPVPRYEVQLRFFHLADNWQSGTSELADDFPLNCQVRIEEQTVTLPPVIPTNRPNVEPKRPSRPVNITPVLQNIGQLGNRPYRISVDWTADKRVWAFSVNVVYRVNTSVLIDRINKRPDSRQPVDQTENTIKRRLNVGDDGEIAMDKLTTSLRCPLMRTRLKTPVRCADCSHLQCYDLENYLQMNEKKPTWKCPVCPQPAPYDRLIIDLYFVKVLGETPTDVDEVELLRDGGWRVLTTDEVSIPSDDDADVKPVVGGKRPASGGSSGAGPTAKKKPAATDDVICLSDSDEDEEVVQAKKESLRDEQPSPASPSPSTRSPPVLRKTAKDIEIITLDDTPPRSGRSGGGDDRVAVSSSCSAGPPSNASTSRPPSEPFHQMNGYMSNGGSTPATPTFPGHPLLSVEQQQSVHRMMMGGQPDDVPVNTTLLGQMNQYRAQAIGQFPAFGATHLNHYGQYMRLYNTPTNQNQHGNANSYNGYVDGVNGVLRSFSPHR